MMDQHPSTGTSTGQPGNKAHSHTSNPEHRLDELQRIIESGKHRFRTQHKQLSQLQASVARHLRLLDGEQTTEDVPDYLGWPLHERLQHVTETINSQSQILQEQQQHIEYLERVVKQQEQDYKAMYKALLKRDAQIGQWARQHLMTSVRDPAARASIDQVLGQLDYEQSADKQARAARIQKLVQSGVPLTHAYTLTE